MNLLFRSNATGHKRPGYAPIFLLILLITPFIGCSEDAGESGMSEATLIDSSSTTLTNLHPILDRKVRPGDAMLYDLDSLIQEGLLLDEDMELIGFHVRSLGGMNDPDGVLATKSYRELVREALFSDMSDGSTPCELCTDSLIIYFPGNNAQIFLGMAEVSLEEMIGIALSSGSTLPQYSRPPYNQRIDSTGWQEMMDRLYAERDAAYDPILFGNTLIYIAEQGDKISEYTYGQILSVVERVKEMKEFVRVRESLERLATEAEAEGAS